MVSKVVTEAFHTKLVGGGSTWNGIPVVDVDTDPEPPSDAEAFIVVQFPVSLADNPTLGRRYFENGGARIVLNVVRGIGLAQGLEWADGIAALFRTEKIAPSIETFASQSPIIDDTNESGNWYSFAVIVPYRYQFDG